MLLNSAYPLFWSGDHNFHHQNDHLIPSKYRKLNIKIFKSDEIEAFWTLFNFGPPCLFQVMKKRVMLSSAEHIQHLDRFGEIKREHLIVVEPSLRETVDRKFREYADLLENPKVTFQPRERFVAFWDREEDRNMVLCMWSSVEGILSYDTLPTDKKDYNSNGEENQIVVYWYVPDAFIFYSHIAVYLFITWYLNLVEALRQLLCLPIIYTGVYTPFYWD